MQLGHYKEWSWLTTNKMYIADVLAAYPNLVINKHVLITSYDSGLVILDEKKLQSGWIYSGHVCHPHEFAKEAEPDRQFALSPRVADPQILPLDMYDEWYVFENPPKINELLVYVNYEFRLSLGHMGLYEMAEHWLEERFWQQLAALNPIAYVADNQHFLFASADTDLFEEVALCAQEIEYKWHKQQELKT